MADTLNVYGVTYAGVTGIKAKDNNDNTLTFVKPAGTLTITEDGTYDCSAYASVVVTTQSE